MPDEHAPDDKAAAAAPAKAPSKGVLIGVIAGGVLAGAGAGAFVIAPKLAPAPVAAEEPADAKGKKGEHAKKKEKKGKGGKEGEEAEKARLVKFENLVVNPAGSDGGRFLMVTVAIEVSDEAVGREIKSMDVKVRDKITAMLSALTLQQIGAPDARTVVKTRVAGILTEELGDEAELEVYLPQFVVQ